jgi:hypothetical protein
VVPARVSPLSGQPDRRDLAFMVNSTYFWFDHEVDQNFVELTIAGRSPDAPPLERRRCPPTAGWCSESGVP